MNGNTNAQNVLRRPSCAIIRYIGTTVTVPGTINVAMYTQNNASPPEKSKRANAYPASTEKVNCPTRITAVIKAVTAAARPNPAEARSAKLRSVWGGGSCSGVPVGDRWAEVDDVSKPSPNGTKVISAPTVSPAYITTFQTRLGEVIADPSPEIQML